MANPVEIYQCGDELTVKFGSGLDPKVQEFLFSNEGAPLLATGYHHQQVPPNLGWMSSIVAKAALWEAEEGSITGINKRCFAKGVQKTHIITPKQMLHLFDLYHGEVYGRPPERLMNIVAKAYNLGRSGLALAVVLDDPAVREAYATGPVDSLQGNSIGYEYMTPDPETLNVRVGVVYRDGLQRICIDNDVVPTPTIAEMAIEEGAARPDEIKLHSVINGPGTILSHLLRRID